MNISDKGMAAVFNEWARRYAEDPSAYSGILDADGKPFADYGDACAATFAVIADEIKAS